jgi:3',5'-cyclic AMP phosphodiesterase CpdA
MIIAQISDIHLHADGPPLGEYIDPLGSLEAAVAHLRAFEPRPDVVLVTGDLVSAPDRRSYALLREYLDQLAMPVYVIPGNHDGRAEVRDAFGDQGYLPREGEFLHYTVEDYPLRLIGLDTVVPGEEGGCMCGERLAWLEARLGEDPKRPTLIFMHHPPFETGIGFMDKFGFEGGGGMDAVVGRHPQVEWVLCGHLHRQIQTRWGGTVVSTAPSISFQIMLDLAQKSPGAYVMEPPASPILAWTPDSSIRTYLSVIGDYGPNRSFA